MENSVNREEALVFLNLASLERGVKAIELAHINGLRLVPNGRELDVRRDPQAENYNKEQAERIVSMLGRGKEELLAITGNPTAVRDVLVQSQRQLANHNEKLFTYLDLWDRLEKVYRLLFSDDTGCIGGENGCPADAVACCKACEGKSTNGK